MEIYKTQLITERIKGNKAMALTLIQAPHYLFLPIKLEQQEDIVELMSLKGQTQSYEIIYQLELENKLRYLLNIGDIYQSLHKTAYTYQLVPKNIVFDHNGLPKLIHRGIIDQIEPYETITEEHFLYHYKAMIVSTIDVKTQYDALIEGKLIFYKGNLFCETIIQANTIAEVMALLSEQYTKERDNNVENYMSVARHMLSRLKIATIISSSLAIFLLAILAYILIFRLPHNHTIADIRLAFTQQDYSKVVTHSQNINSRQLSQEDKYLVAYATIMTEPLTEKQKEVLSQISIQSNEDYLRYWVLIGQNHIDEAMDIASYLDDPQLLIYSTTKKIDELQRNPDLTSEKRTEMINNYKNKLEELKKQYLTTEEVTTIPQSIEITSQSKK